MGPGTNKDTFPVLANGVIPVIILLKSPIFHLSGIRENGKSGNTLHARLQMFCISSDVNSTRTRATLGQQKISNLDGLTTQIKREAQESKQMQWSPPCPRDGPPQQHYFQLSSNFRD